MEQEHLHQLRDYIRQQYRSGLHPDEIAQQLESVGWPNQLIQQAFAAVQAEMVPTGYATPAESIEPQPVGSDHNTGSPALQPQATGKRRGRVRTGWQLCKVCFSILRGNKYLLRYLALTAASVIATLVVFIVIAIILNNSLFSTNLAGGNNDGLSRFGMIVMFIYYILIYFFINFFAAAMALNILDIFKGQQFPIKVYLRAAWSRAGAIFFYSLISATIGFLLNYVIERIRYIGWILAWLLGTAWSLSTLFVLPIIMHDPNISAPKAIKESLKFFKATWGENVTAKISVNLPLALINMAALCITIGIVFLAITTGIWPLIWVIIILYWLFAIGLAIIGSFANSILNVALFYYANYHQIPPSFSAELLNSVFIKRKRSRLGKKLATEA